MQTGNKHGTIKPNYGKWRENKNNKPDLTSKAKIRLNIRNILRIAVISV